MKLFSTISKYFSAKSNDVSNSIRKSNNVSFAKNSIEKMQKQKQLFATAISEERTEYNKLKTTLYNSRQYLGRQQEDARQRKIDMQKTEDESTLEYLKQEQRTCVIGMNANKATIQALEAEIVKLGKVINKHEAQFGRLTAELTSAETRLKIAEAKNACNKTIASLELADDSDLTKLEEDVETEETYNSIMESDINNVTDMVSDEDMEEYF